MSRREQVIAEARRCAQEEADETGECYWLCIGQGDEPDWCYDESKAVAEKHTKGPVMFVYRIAPGPKREE